MGSLESWSKKLDPYSRMMAEEGLPAGGVEVTIRLSREGAAVKELEQAGLEMHAQVNDIIVGRVANSDDLKRVAELDCVQDVQVARPLYDGLSDTP